jgi:hypothetical protein
VAVGRLQISGDTGRAFHAVECLVGGPLGHLTRSDRSRGQGHRAHKGCGHGSEDGVPCPAPSAGTAGTGGCDEFPYARLVQPAPPPGDAAGACRLGPPREGGGEQRGRQEQPPGREVTGLRQPVAEQSVIQHLGRGWEPGQQQHAGRSTGEHDAGEPVRPPAPQQRRHEADQRSGQERPGQGAEPQQHARPHREHGERADGEPQKPVPCAVTVVRVIRHADESTAGDRDPSRTEGKPELAQPSATRYSPQGTRP